VLERIEDGYGREQDLPLLGEVGQNILFRAFCALADGAVSPVDSSIKYFRGEYEEHLRLGRCPFVPVPGFGAGVLTPEGNLASWIDGHWFAGHINPRWGVSPRH
jgi:hypothetical protein